MTVISAMIVDDEAPSRELLEDMLGAIEGIEVVGNFCRSADALSALSESPPDVLFLDIQMPDMQGFELLERMPIDQRPLVVFVTAFQDHAHKAFDVEAVDYLLKPFDENRLMVAVARVRRRLKRAAAPPATPSEQLERISVRADDRNYFVRIDRILWLEADGRLVRLHAEDGVHDIRETLARIEARLNPRDFVRVSRAAIVNVNRIREVQTWFRGDRIIVMENDEVVTTTRGYRENLLRLLEN